jgi:hypothetical protein
MAEALEIAAKAGDYAAVEAGNEPFIQKVEELLPRFAEMIERAEGTESGGKNKLPEPDRALLTKILEAGAEYDIEMMQKTLEELEKHDYESGGELVKWIRERVVDFAYDEVREKLEETLR